MKVERGWSFRMTMQQSTLSLSRPSAAFFCPVHGTPLGYPESLQCLAWSSYRWMVFLARTHIFDLEMGLLGSMWASLCHQSSAHGRITHREALGLFGTASLHFGPLTLRISPKGVADHRIVEVSNVG